MTWVGFRIAVLVAAALLTLGLELHSLVLGIASMVLFAVLYWTTVVSVGLRLLRVVVPRISRS